MTEKTKDELLSAIQEENIVLPTEFPIEFFNKIRNKTTQLIGNSDPEKYQKGQHKWYEISVKETIFINSITIITSKYTKYDGAQIKITNPRYSSEMIKATKNTSDQFIFEINDFATSFAFRPDGKYFTSPEIQKITIIGYSSEEIDEITGIASNIEGYSHRIFEKCQEITAEANARQEELDNFEASKSSIESEIETLTENKEKIESEIKDVTEQIDSYNIRLTSFKSAESDVKMRVSSLEDSIDGKKQEQRVLNAQLSEDRSILKKLEDDINMFPSEISAFVQQGGKSIKGYTFFAVVPIAIIFGVTYALLSGAADLTVLYKEPEGFDIWTVFITRLPFVAIATAILAACYKLTRVFISEILNINRQRLNLSTISIIATDVSLASCEGLEPDSKVHAT